MLEFIIALLLSLGFQPEDPSSLPELDAKTMDIIRADGKYEELGGDKEYQSIFGSGDTGTNGEDNIVITIDPNPEGEA